MLEEATPEFYRQQAERLTQLAAAAADPGVRLELLEIAAGFQKLARYAGVNRNADAEAAAPKSA